MRDLNKTILLGELKSIVTSYILEQTEWRISQRVSRMHFAVSFFLL